MKQQFGECREDLTVESVATSTNQSTAVILEYLGWMGSLAAVLAYFGG